MPFANELHDAAKKALAAEALEEACRAYDRGRYGSVDVDFYIAFALDTYSEAMALPEWRALKRRRRIGSVASPFIPISSIRGCFDVVCDIDFSTIDGLEAVFKTSRVILLLFECAFEKNRHIRRNRPRNLPRLLTAQVDLIHSDARLQCTDEAYRYETSCRRGC